MNTNEIKARLARLQGNKGGAQKQSSGKRWSENFFKPKQDTKYEVRIVRYEHSDDSLPFTELYFYFGIGKPRMLSLVNFEEADPIMEFQSELKKADYEGNKALIKKLNAKLRIFVPVIVRGEEDKGVRFWEFGPQVYGELLQYLDDPDYGDITDVEEGFDIKIESISPAKSGKAYPTTTLKLKPRTSPLSDDAEQAEAWLTNQPNVKELYSKVEYEDMKSALQDYIQPKAEEDQPVKSSGTNYTNTKKEDVNAQLDKMFDDE
jgi:hypothetical protein